jgi:hypothetical protein
MVSFDEMIPKKRCREKHCLLCKKHGGAHTTHNTLDYRKYIPTEPQRRTSTGKSPMEPLMDPRDLLKEEVAKHNYLLKSKN